MCTNKSAIVKIQAAIIAIVIFVAAVAGVFVYYTYFAPKPSPARPTEIPTPTPTISPMPTLTPTPSPTPAKPETPTPVPLAVARVKIELIRVIIYITHLRERYIGFSIGFRVENLGEESIRWAGIGYDVYANGAKLYDRSILIEETIGANRSYAYIAYDVASTLPEVWQAIVNGRIDWYRFVGRAIFETVGGELKVDFDLQYEGWRVLMKEVSAPITPTPIKPEEILIGSLLPLTGPLATFGENSKVAIDMAVEEVNEFLKASGVAWTMKVIHEDTQTKPDVALKKLTSLYAKGVKFIVGPMISGEVQKIKGYVDANKILAISQYSASLALAIPDDFIFRFCPTDLTEGPAIARLMYDDGKRYIIPVWRGSAWADGLVAATKTRFEELGGTFLPREYIAEALADAVTSAVDKYGVDKVGVYYVAAAVEALQYDYLKFFYEARHYPILWTVRWYGSCVTCLDELMIAHLEVAEFAAATRFINPIFAPTRSDKYEKVHDKVVAVLGREPDSYAYIAYDIVWALTHSLLTVSKYDSEAVREVLPDVTESILGASGRIVLDENGDRVSADYDLWVIAEVAPGKYDWKLVGTYTYDTDSITWL